MKQTPLLTPNETAEILGVTRQRVMQLIENGILETKGRFGSTTAIVRNSVVAERRRRAKLKNGNAKPKGKRRL